MEKLNLHDDIERNVVMEKICASTKKDKFGRRKSFRMTQQEIQKAIEERIEGEISSLLKDKEAKVNTINKKIGKRKSNRRKKKK